MKKVIFILSLVFFLFVTSIAVYADPYIIPVSSTSSYSFSPSTETNDIFVPVKQQLRFRLRLRYLNNMYN